MKVLYKTRGETSRMDPIGQLGEGSPELIEANLIEDTLYFSGKAQDTTLSQAQEGTNPGEWQRISRLSTVALNQVKALFQTLMADSDSDIANAAKIMVSILTGNVDIAILTTLRNTALNGNNKTLRLFAIILIGMIVLEERD